jgi:hypothetical protein
VIEGMFGAKLNVLKLLVADERAFRLQLPSWPLLTNESFYSCSDGQRLARFAADRGVQIVLKFEVAKTASLVSSLYPELGSVVLDGPRSMSFLSELLSTSSGCFGSALVDVGSFVDQRRGVVIGSYPAQQSVVDAISSLAAVQSLTLMG